MARDLPFFQFEPAQYMSGSIQFCSLKAQGLFINILSIYWQRGCDLTINQVKKRWNEPDIIQELIDENVIKVSDDKIYIQFLNNQFNNVLELSKTRSENAKKGNAKRWGEDRKPIANPSQEDLKPIASIVEYSIVEKSLVDNIPVNGTNAKPKRVKKSFVPPSIDLVRQYFDQNGYTEYGADKAYRHYNEADWHDTTGKPVLSWKQKMSTNWFREEFKKPESKKAQFVA